MQVAIEYNAGRVFFAGAQFPVEIRLTTVCPEIDTLCVEIRQSGELIAADEPDEILSPEHPLHLRLPYAVPESLHGIVSFEVYIGYRQGDACQWYKARTPGHRVSRREEKVRSVIEHLTIDMSNRGTISSDRAGDVTYQNELKGLESLLPTCTAEQVMDRLTRLPPVWEPLEFIPCAPKRALRNRAAHAPANAVQDRFQLVSGQRQVGVHGAASVQIGRSKSNPVRAYVSLEDPRAEEAANVHHVSRFHCRAVRTDSGFVIEDRAEDLATGRTRESTHGTYLDGNRILAGQSVDLPAGRERLLTLGSADSRASDVVGFSCRVYRYGEAPAVLPSPAPVPGAACALALRPLRDGCHPHLIVHRLARICWIVPGAAESCAVEHTAQGWLFHQAGAPARWLVAGDRLDLGTGEPWEVRSIRS